MKKGNRIMKIKNRFGMSSDLKNVLITLAILLVLSLLYIGLKDKIFAFFD